MMTRLKSRLSSASKDDSADAVTHSKAASGADLIGLKAKGLKEFFADEFIKGNDESDELQLDDNELEEQLENLCDKPVHRILNKEIGKNMEEMQPLMTMDKELCPMTSDVETEEEEDNEKENVYMKRKNPLNQQQSAKKRKLCDKNEINNGIKFMETKKFIYYDTWHVIKPQDWPSETRQYRQCLDFPLVKLANALTSMKLPSNKWSSKVTLYKVLPAVLKRHTLTIFSGDLKIHNIPERDRQKYQPSCVILRRENTSMQNQTKCFVPFDRIIIFKNQQIFINFEGKLVQLNGAPEKVNCLKDVAKLLDIIHSISLSNPMIEIVNPK